MPAVDGIDVSDLEEETLASVYARLDEKHEAEKTRRYRAWNHRLKERFEHRQDRLAPQVNLFFFAFFGIPVLAEYLGWWWPYYYHMYSIIIHEVGHFVFGTLPWAFGVYDKTLAYAGGSLLQLLVPLASFVFLARNPRTYLVASLFLLALGLDVMDVGAYMGTALEPWGMTSYYGAIRGQRGDMNEQSHDFSVVFRRTGLILKSKAIGAKTIAVGEAIAAVGAAATFLGAIHLVRLYPFRGYLALLAIAGILGFVGLVVQDAVYPALYALGFVLPYGLYKGYRLLVSPKNTTSS